MSDILGLIIDNKLITILITMFGTFYWLINRMRTEVNEKKKEFMDKILFSEISIQSFKNEIEEKLYHNPNLYKEELGKALKFLNKYLGELKLFSSNAFNKHITLSFIYSFFFFYSTWLFGFNGHIGNYEFMPNENRFIITLYLIFQMIVINFLFTHLIEIEKSPLNKLPYFSSLTNKWKINILVFTIGLTPSLIGVLLILGGILTLTIIELAGLIILVTMGVILINVEILSKKLFINSGKILILIGVWLLSLEVIGITLGNIINSNTILYLLFFLILPFLNAIFDYLSMLASRYFAQKILYKHTKKLEIFWDIFFDLLIAAILFVVLAFSLYYIVNFTNVYLIKNEALFIPIEYYKELLLSWNLLHPHVLWITLMFVSTLIPTFIHLYLFVYSLMAFIIVKPHLHKVVEDLENLDLDNHHKKELVAYDLANYRLTGWLRIHNFFLSALAIGFFVLLGVLLSTIR